MTTRPEETITIRRAGVQDVALILRFIRGLAEYEELTGQLEVDEARLREHLFGERPAAEVLLGAIDGKEVGFALFFQSFSTFLGKPGLYLEDLFVEPDWRHHGVGKSLLLALGALAHERGCGRLEWAVLDWNQPTIDFYLSLGSAPLTEWTTHRVTGEALANLAERAREEGVQIAP